ncbi:hypothetical protein MYSTI_05409 [Myxococcus stipitatus DSM 14675]|uniref:Uncharacterized protein n=1 Tax=Myxococcus stipitatus (strain DSM 14675 / JCM 12634 / Mx s8) TaxID=1278073 RepID=L7UF71_MYXSD|nr:RING finger protein [Myxococcus stipitatus]AGC46688.1 hypothetical protein MYSTI_05409 [Myxococcus stipitatus DSM 14675]
MAELQPHAADAFAGNTCGICQTGIEVGEEVGTCPACQAPFHAECWAENGGCAQYGCAHMPGTSTAEAPTAAHTYWGQEEKTCFDCGQQIKVAALRCRFCGAVFSSNQPLSSSEVVTQEQVSARRAAAGRVAVGLFVAGLMPCTAPLALLAGGVWCLNNRETIRKLPSQRRVMAWVGLGAAASSTVLMLLAALFLGS